MYHPNSNIERSVMAECGIRTSALAGQVAMQGSGHLDYVRLSSAMCWDAMLICACDECWQKDGG
jgi:hypothetical protein